MCGRYRLSRRKQVLAEHFDAVPFEDDWEPRYNIAPTQQVPVIRQHPEDATTRAIADAVGIDSILGERHFGVRKHDKCKIRNSRHEASIP